MNLTLLPHQEELIPKQTEEIPPRDNRVSPCRPLRGRSFKRPWREWLRPESIRKDYPVKARKFCTNTVGGRGGGGGK